MILESMVALIGSLAVRVGKDFASNVYNRIINAAIDAVNQNQQEQLSELKFGIRSLQDNQDELKTNQIREMKAHYQNGIDFIRYANTATGNEQKKNFINEAIISFTHASNVEVGVAKVNAIVLIGACFYALRLIDNTTAVALENGQYDMAFQLAEKIPGPAPQTPYFHFNRQPSLRPSFIKRPPSRELIEQLLRIPYLQQKYGPIEDYWKKKWEPPKQVEAPKLVGTQLSRPSSRLGSLSGQHRKCVSCGKQFVVPFGQFSTQQYCPECSPKLPDNNLRSLIKTKNNLRSWPQTNPYTTRKTCQKCHKQFDEPITFFNLKNYCPECRSKYP